MNVEILDYLESDAHTLSYKLLLKCFLKNVLEDNAEPLHLVMEVRVEPSIDPDGYFDCIEHIEVGSCESVNITLHFMDEPFVIEKRGTFTPSQALIDNVGAAMIPTLKQDMEMFHEQEKVDYLEGLAEDRCADREDYGH